MKSMKVDEPMDSQSVIRTSIFQGQPALNTVSFFCMSTCHLRFNLWFLALYKFNSFITSCHL